MSQTLKSLIIAAWMMLPAVSLAQAPTSQTPPAQAQPPGYLLVVGKTTDRAKVGAYAAALPPIYAQNDAYYLAIGGAGRGETWLEGPWADRSIIFGKFPSRAQIDAFWWGDAYRAAIRKRDNAGAFSVVALTGTTPFMLEGTGTGYFIVMTGPRDASATQARLSQAASVALLDGVLASGGTLLTSTEAGQFTSLEGDTVFDRFTIAVWPSLGARDAYLASRPARRAARLRARLGTSAVASANGVPRTQAPPAVVPVQPVVR
jgi:uncharacterized protein (DUF1330 family)